MIRQLQAIVWKYFERYFKYMMSILRCFKYYCYSVFWNQDLKLFHLIKYLPNNWSNLPSAPLNLWLYGTTEIQLLLLLLLNYGLFSCFTFYKELSFYVQSIHSRWTSHINNHSETIDQKMNIKKLLLLNTSRKLFIVNEHYLWSCAFLSLLNIIWFIWCHYKFCWSLCVCILSMKYRK